MLRTVIIDDEHIVIEGLKKLIAWEKYGFELADYAYNGIDGLEKVIRLKPDFVLVDIKMPGLDGLSLIEKGKKESPYTIFVIISGYSEFYYAQKALMLGVAGYIDKPLTVEKIQETLERAKELYDMQEYMKSMNKSFGSLEEKAFKITLLSLLHSNDVLSGMERELSGECYAKLSLIRQFLVISGFLEDCSKEKSDLINGVFEKHARKSGIEILNIKTGQEFIFVLFSYENAFGEDAVREFLTAANNELARKEIYITLGVGCICWSLDAIQKSHSQADKALKYGRFLEETDVFYSFDLDHGKHSLISPDKEDKSIYNSLRMGDSEKTRDNVKKYLSQLKSYKLPTDIFFQECLKFIYNGQAIAEEIAGEHAARTEAYTLPHEEILGCRTFEEIENFVVCFFGELAGFIKNCRNVSSNKAILDAKRYVEEHFHEDISLERLADAVYLNATYLSIRFKEEFGISYVKYLTRLRIEAAQKLLDKGCKVVDVAGKVGYNNYRYFCDTFKKVVGVTPGNYKMKKS